MESISSLGAALRQERATIPSLIKILILYITFFSVTFLLTEDSSKLYHVNFFIFFYLLLLALVAVSFPDEAVPPAFLISQFIKGVFPGGVALELLMVAANYCIAMLTIIFGSLLAATSLLWDSDLSSLLRKSMKEDFILDDSDMKDVELLEKDLEKYNQDFALNEENLRNVSFSAVLTEFVTTHMGKTSSIIILDIVPLIFDYTAIIIGRVLVLEICKLYLLQRYKEIAIPQFSHIHRISYNGIISVGCAGALGLLTAFEFISTFHFGQANLSPLLIASKVLDKTLLLETQALIALEEARDHVLGLENNIQWTLIFSFLCNSLSAVLGKGLDSMVSQEPLNILRLEERPSLRLGLDALYVGLQCLLCVGVAISCRRKYDSCVRKAEGRFYHSVDL